MEAISNTFLSVPQSTFRSIAAELPNLTQLFRNAVTGTSALFTAGLVGINANIIPITVGVIVVSVALVFLWTQVYGEPKASTPPVVAQKQIAQPTSTTTTTSVPLTPSTTIDLNALKRSTEVTPPDTTSTLKTSGDHLAPAATSSTLKTSGDHLAPAATTTLKTSSDNLAPPVAASTSIRTSGDHIPRPVTPAADDPGLKTSGHHHLPRSTTPPPSSVNSDPVLAPVVHTVTEPEPDAFADTPRSLSKRGPSAALAGGADMALLSLQASNIPEFKEVDAKYKKVPAVQSLFRERSDGLYLKDGRTLHKIMGFIKENDSIFILIKNR